MVIRSFHRSQVLLGLLAWLVGAVAFHRPLLVGSKAQPSLTPSSSCPSSSCPLPKGQQGGRVSPLSVHFASAPEPDQQDPSSSTINVAKSTTTLGPPWSQYMQLELPTLEGISIHDITPIIRDAIRAGGVVEGVVNVVSRHTTTGVMINEYESRLIDDIRQFLLKVAPPTYPYLHNDIHLRPSTEEDKRRLGPSWDIEEWRKQEPKNAHSHLLSMLLGNTLSIPISEGELTIGRWQSVMLVELDGPRSRTVGVQVVAYERNQQANA